MARDQHATPKSQKGQLVHRVFKLPSPDTEIGAIDAADVQFETFRAGGPGGQHQNTTDSAVRAIHGPTGLMAVAREMRSQHRNKALALQRLNTLMQTKAVADQEERKAQRNLLHHALERGNPIRKFKGPHFKEDSR